MPIADPRNPGQRTKAARLRRRAEAGEPLTPEEAAWLDEYVRAQESVKAETAASVGASATERIINIEERSAAVGTGAAAEVAAAAALAREEGRRLDYMLKGSMDAMMRAVTMYESMMKFMMERQQHLETVHISMLEAVRSNYLARTQAEVDAIAAESNKDDKDDLQSQLLGALAAKMVGSLEPPKG